MNKLLRTTSIFVLCALLGGAALANVKSKKIHFNDDVTVGGTLVKKGDYKVSYDSETKELTISNGKQVVVKTKASLDEAKLKGSSFYDPLYNTKQESGTLLLTRVNVGGAFAVIGGEGSATTTAQ